MRIKIKMGTFAPTEAFWATTLGVAFVVIGASDGWAQQYSGYYRLQTMFQAPEGKCLEGNRYDRQSMQGGAAFMDDCQNVSGQLWEFLDQGNGYYKLTTMFQSPEGKCFEGNNLQQTSVLQGGAFLDECQNVSGQFWKIVPQQDGYVRLQTMFLEPQNKCLEGNRFASDAFLGGVAFMDDCQNVSGQLWLITPEGGSAPAVPVSPVVPAAPVDPTRPRGNSGNN